MDTAGGRGEENLRLLVFGVCDICVCENLVCQSRGVGSHTSVNGEGFRVCFAVGAVGEPDQICVFSIQVQGRGQKPIVHGLGGTVANASGVGSCIRAAGKGFPSVGIVVCIDGRPAQRQGGNSHIVKILNVGESVHGGVGQGGELPDGAVFGIAAISVERHHLPIVNRAVSQVARMVVNSFGLSGSVHQVGGRGVCAKIQFVAVNGSAAGAPAEVCVDGHVGGVVCGNRVHSGAGRCSLRGRCEGEKQAFSGIHISVDAAGSIVNGSRGGGSPIFGGAAVVKILV